MVYFTERFKTACPACVAKGEQVIAGCRNCGENEIDYWHLCQWCGERNDLPVVVRSLQNVHPATCDFCGEVVPADKDARPEYGVEKTALNDECEQADRLAQWVGIRPTGRPAKGLSSHVTVESWADSSSSDGKFRFTFANGYLPSSGEPTWNGKTLHWGRDWSQIEAYPFGASAGSRREDDQGRPFWVFQHPTKKSRWAILFPSLEVNDSGVPDEGTNGDTCALLFLREDGIEPNFPSREEAFEWYRGGDTVQEGIARRHNPIVQTDDFNFSYGEVTVTYRQEFKKEGKK